MIQAALLQPISVIMYEPGARAGAGHSFDVLEQYFLDKVREDLNSILTRINKCVKISLEEHGLEISEETLDEAYLWMEQFYGAAAESKSNWIDPLISPNDEGEIVFEWWSGSKKLTVRIGSGDVEAVRRWGVRPNNGRVEVEISSDLDRRQTWVWLTAK